MQRGNMSLFQKWLLKIDEDRYRYRYYELYPHVLSIRFLEGENENEELRIKLRLKIFLYHLQKLYDNKIDFDVEMSNIDCVIYSSYKPIIAKIKTLADASYYRNLMFKNTSIKSFIESLRFVCYNSIRRSGFAFVYLSYIFTNLLANILSYLTLAKPIYKLLNKLPLIQNQKEVYLFSIPYLGSFPKVGRKNKSFNFFSQIAFGFDWFYQHIGTISGIFVSAALVIPFTLIELVLNPIINIFFYAYEINRCKNKIEELEKKFKIMTIEPEKQSFLLGLNDKKCPIGKVFSKNNKIADRKVLRNIFEMLDGSPCRTRNLAISNQEKKNDLPIHLPEEKNPIYEDKTIVRSSLVTVGHFNSNANFKAEEKNTISLFSAEVGR